LNLQLGICTKYDYRVQTKCHHIFAAPGLSYVIVTVCLPVILSVTQWAG